MNWRHTPADEQSLQDTSGSATLSKRARRLLSVNRWFVNFFRNSVPFIGSGKHLKRNNFWYYFFIKNLGFWLVNMHLLTSDLLLLCLTARELTSYFKAQDSRYCTFLNQMTFRGKNCLNSIYCNKVDTL